LALLSIVSLMALSCPTANAAGDVSATAEMSRPEVNAGEMAELQVRVTGAEVADVPHEVSVDGLQIRLTGESTQVQMVNFKVSSSVVYSYVVMPLRAGKFTIPSIAVRTTAGILRTGPVNFSVIDGSGGLSNTSPAPVQPQIPQPGMPGFSQPQAAPQAASADESRLAFGEISCPKKAVYAGEMVPVEIRFYFDAHYPVKVGRVDLGSEGIVVERFPDPKESRVDRDGITYNVLTFHTLLSAVQPGSIDIAPAKLDSQIQMPGALPPGFDDPVFQQVLGGQSPFTESREVTVKTAPLHLDVMPLPKEGRPASFAGAVGQFDLDAAVTNPKPAPGDPVDLTIKISGKGNFNAMGGPVLTETDGWRTYPPSDKFEGSDEMSNSGVKTFDFTIIAQEPKKASPSAEFSYFDPVTAKYQILVAKPQPLFATPGNLPAMDSASVTNSISTPIPMPTATPVIRASGPYREGDPLAVVTLNSWRPLVGRAEFLIANFAMLIAMAAFAGILRYYHIQKEGGTVSSRRRRRANELLVLLKSDTLDAAATYDAALEYAALIPGESQELISLIKSLTARRDELKYGSGRSVALSREEREELMKSLNKPSSNSSR